MNNYKLKYLLILLIFVQFISSCKESTTNTNDNNNNYDYPGLTYLSDSPNKSKYHTIMNFCRNGVQLQDGRVYFVGGTQGTNAYDMKVQEPELYNPDTDTWQTIPNYSWTHSRYAGKLFLCPNGKLFYMRGDDVYGHKSLYCYLIYPDKSFTSRQFSCPFSAEEIQDAALLDNGKVMMITKVGHVFSLDIEKETIEKISIILPYESGYKLDTYTYGAKISAVPGGNAIITGGLGESTLHQNRFGYDYLSGKFFLNDGRFDHYSITIPDGRVLIVGGGSGLTGVSSNLTEIYDPKTKTSTPINTTPVNAMNFSQSFEILDNERVFCMANNVNGVSAFGNYQIFNIKNSTYTSDQKLKTIFSNSFVDGVTVVKLKNGDLLLNGINHKKPDSRGTLKITQSSLK
jgi:hypothetical protein